MSTGTISSTNMSFNSMRLILLPRSYTAGTALSLTDLSVDERYPQLSTPPRRASNLAASYYWQEFIIEGTGTVDVVQGNAFEYQNVANDYMRTKVIDIDTYQNIVIRAVGTYPNYVEGFYTEANGGGEPVRLGTQPGTGDHTLDWQPVTGGSANSHASNATIYVRFVDAHNP